MQNRPGDRRALAAAVLGIAMLAGIGLPMAASAGAKPVMAPVPAPARAGTDDTPPTADRRALAVAPVADHILVKRVGQAVSSEAVPPGRTAAEYAAERSGAPDVEFAEQDRRRVAHVIPNDPGFNAANNGQWNLNNTGQEGGEADADIDAPEAWDLAGISGPGQYPNDQYTIGVVDSGIQANHPDFAGKLTSYCKQFSVAPGSLTSGCPDGEGHGTHVAGIIAAATNNSAGIAGVAPDARLAICRALDDEGAGLDADIAACVNDLVANKDTLNLKAINLSLGGPGVTATLQNAMDAAEAAGIVLVASSGNSGTTVVEYPAGFDSVISVAATSRTDDWASFSNSNADVELSAPGVEIPAPYPTNNYALISGTSQAAPHVAAAAGFVAFHQGLSGDDTRARLTASADDQDLPGRDAKFGFGRLNLCRAMGGCGFTVPSTSTTNQVSTTSTTSSVSTTSTAPGNPVSTTSTSSTIPSGPGGPVGGAANGYRMVARDGGIFSFGAAGFYGSTGNLTLSRPIVAMASTPTGLGYWMVAADGGVFAFGDAGFFGGTTVPGTPIIAMAATPTGKGYWLLAADGNLRNFGDADFFGGIGTVGQLRAPLVGMAVTPSGKGYWLVASDGGVFSFGDATFFGSTGNIRLNQPIVGMAATPDGRGYWMTASDGGVFAFGTAGFFGSTGNIRLNKPVVGMQASPSGKGYRFVASDGGVFTFGDLRFFGSTGNITLNQPVVGIS